MGVFSIVESGAGETRVTSSTGVVPGSMAAIRVASPVASGSRGGVGSCEAAVPAPAAWTSPAGEAVPATVDCASSAAGVAPEATVCASPAVEAAPAIVDCPSTTVAASVETVAGGIGVHGVGCGRLRIGARGVSGSGGGRLRIGARGVSGSGCGRLRIGARGVSGSGGGRLRIGARGVRRAAVAVGCASAPAESAAAVAVDCASGSVESASAVAVGCASASAESAAAPAVCTSASVEAAPARVVCASASVEAAPETSVCASPAGDVASLANSESLGSSSANHSPTPIAATTNRMSSALRPARSVGCSVSFGTRHFLFSARSTGGAGIRPGGLSRHLRPEPGPKGETDVSHYCNPHDTPSHESERAVGTGRSRTPQTGRDSPGRRVLDPAAGRWRRVRQRRYPSPAPGSMHGEEGSLRCTVCPGGTGCSAPVGPSPPPATNA